MPKKRIPMNSCDIKDIIFPNCLMLYGSIYWKMNNIKTQGVVTSLKTLYMSNKPATLRSIKLYLK